MATEAQPDAPAVDTLRQELRSVAALRDDLAKVKDEVARRLAAFKEANAPLFKAQQVTAQALETVEDNARALALAAYARTGDKHPAPGCDIKLITALQYDPREAYHWAQRSGMALIPESVDIGAFEKIVRAAPGSFPFVTVLEEPQAQIATKLGEALAAAEVAA